ncbi:MAG: AbrB/MazE/SpoVT family DNA-binding domain-containing protein [Candidatus Micrarchaeota archaeon]
MRTFKHGESLAIVIPEKVRQALAISENEEFEFFEVDKGTLILISKKNLKDRTIKSVISDLVKISGEGRSGTDSINQALPSASENEPASKAGGFLEKGFLVVAIEEEARRLSKQYEKEIKTNEIMGVRGFDKKFYIVSAPYFKQNYPKIMKAIGSRELALRDISLATKMEEAGCNACLQVMKEAGEVIEKRRGVFKAIK